MRAVNNPFYFAVSKSIAIPRSSESCYTIRCNQRFADLLGLLDQLGYYRLAARTTGLINMAAASARVKP
jgi:hypothetical protein